MIAIIGKNTVTVKVLIAYNILNKYKKNKLYFYHL